MKVVTVIQRKGGNGKSTATANLAHAFAAFFGKRVLVIDADDQRNTSSTIPTRRPIAKTVESLLVEDETWVEDVAERTLWEGVDLIAGDAGLSSAIAELEGHMLLRPKLQAAEGYDLCLIDTSPSLNIVTVNAMCASDGLFIPLVSSYFSLQGLAQTMDSYRKIRNTLNHELEVYGIAFVHHFRRTRLAGEVREKVKEQFPELLCETVITQNVAIELAQVRRQSIFSYAPNDRGAVQYRALAGELAIRMKL